MLSIPNYPNLTGIWYYRRRRCTMSEETYQPPSGFLTMTQAQERLGVSKATFQKIVKRRGLVAHRDERDTRVKLLRIQDVDELTRPVPTGAVEQLKTAA
jgi:excisionase family DNA binding protein